MSKKKLLVLILVVLFAWPSMVFAASPEGPGLGARAISMGGAFIGVADDWTATYWNPAGLAQQKEIGFGVTCDYPTTHGKDSNSAANPLSGNVNGIDQGEVFSSPSDIINPGIQAVNAVLPPALQSSLMPDEPDHFNKTSISSNTLLPGLGAYFPVKGFTIGVAAYQPIGHRTEWKDVVNTDAVTMDADYSTKTYLTVINLSIAKKIKTLSLGAGVNFLQGEYDRYSRKNVTYNNPLTLSAFHMAAAAANNLDFSDLNNGYGAEQEVKTEGKGVEGIAGFLFQPTEKFSIGGVYRTGAQIDFEGYHKKSHTVLPNGESGVRRVFNMPATYGIGLAFRPISNWVLTADWQRTEWDTMGTEIWYEKPDSNAAMNNIPYQDSDWRNTDRWRFGTEFKPSDTNLALRAGFYLDPSQIPNKSLGLTSIVEVNRKVVCAGIGYTLNNWQFDLTYLYTMGSTNYNGVDYEKTVSSVQAAISYWFGG